MLAKVVLSLFKITGLILRDLMLKIENAFDRLFTFRWLQHKYEAWINTGVEIASKMPQRIIHWKKSMFNQIMNAKQTNCRSVDLKWTYNAAQTCGWVQVVVFLQKKISLTALNIAKKNVWYKIYFWGWFWTDEDNCEYFRMLNTIGMYKAADESNMQFTKTK